MTAKQIIGIVSLWQGLLGLETWDILVDLDEPADDDNEAQAERSIFYDKAALKFAKSWRTWTNVYAHRVIVHELLHLVTRDLDQAHSSLEGQLHPHVWTLANERYIHEIEGVVDRLALRLVEIANVR